MYTHQWRSLQGGEWPGYNLPPEMEKLYEAKSADLGRPKRYQIISFSLIIRPTHISTFISGYATGTAHIEY